MMPSWTCRKSQRNEGGTWTRTTLVLKRASASRPSGEWNDDDFDVLADSVVVGRIFKANAARLDQGSARVTADALDALGRTEETKALRSGRGSRVLTALSPHEGLSGWPRALLAKVKQQRALSG